MRRTSVHNSEEDIYQSPQKGPSIDSEMEEDNSEVVVNKIKTQSIDKNKFMRTQEVGTLGSSDKKVKTLGSFSNSAQKNSP
jgi:hypothetical protein